MTQTITRYAGTARMSNMVAYRGVLVTKGITARGMARDITAQTRDVLRQLDALLAEAGLSKSALLQVMIWLADSRDFDAANAVYDAWVAPGEQPVRACVESRLASPEILIEIQASAALASAALG
ncbi:RidA family protein [Ancylobacter oerskovii]|uniref:RidA family protein n=1 Tax=Ancylobacter oerskovii TaxID=459519 RepID=A0ABW4YUS1_9HYPH|nr:RidA family protein [Ancylobacter oerskovii]MBS7544614.1 RidA family protein [Ancylobacter oerskovii]